MRHSTKNHMAAASCRFAADIPAQFGTRGSTLRRYSDLSCATPHFHPAQIKRCGRLRSGQSAAGHILPSEARQLEEKRRVFRVPCGKHKASETTGVDFIRQQARRNSSRFEATAFCVANWRRKTGKSNDDRAKHARRLCFVMKGIN